MQRQSMGDGELDLRYQSSAYDETVTSSGSISCFLIVTLK